MKTALCTISANNFVSYGLECIYSAKKYNDYDFYYLIADKFISSLYSNYCGDINFISLNEIGIPEEELCQMEFKYSIVEFNTSVKPAFYNFLFNKGYENIIYLDPDIECYNKFSYLDGLLDKSSIVLTPHKLTCNKSPFFDENDFLNNGIYNLGFIGMHNCEETKKFLHWWDKYLRDSCYLDYSKGFATDQIWTNLAPIYFSNVNVCCHPGMNLAFWNIHERQIVFGDTIMVNNEALQFIHFSSLSINCKQNLLLEIYKLEPAFEKIYKEHIEKIKLYNYNQFSKINYAYNFYDNSEFITKEQKRFYGYARLFEKGYKNPFYTGKKSFYSDFKKGKLKFNKIAISAAEQKLKIFIKVFGLKRILNWSKYFSGINTNHISQLYK